ncbi:hypothetical protein C2E23DRAFT_39386 [Lenzites betulinus]|nr:hypothetical protein C2E23DRAFT_39386 [Lenzites betulinus]
MSSSDDIEFVDDTNPRVQYAPGWEWDQGLAEVDTTRHGASTAGLKAWLSFTGAGVRVIGTLGDSNTYGQPKTTYLVDGVVAGSYSAPFSGQTQYNVTFFSMRDLPLGDHVILINNTDGTSPNQFLLDYFLIDKTSSANSSPGPTSPPAVVNPPPPASSNPPPSTHSSTTSHTTSTSPLTTSTNPSSNATPNLSSEPDLRPVSNSGSSAPSQTIPSGSATMTGSNTASLPVGFVTTLGGLETAVSTTTVPVLLTQAGATQTNGPLSDAAQTASHSNVAVIAGAAVAGVCALAVLAVLLFCLRRRRKNASRADPFALSQSQDAGDALFDQKPSRQRTATNMNPTSVTASHRSAHDAGQAELAVPSAGSPESVASFSEQHGRRVSSEAALPVPARFAFPHNAPYLSSGGHSSQNTEKPHSPISPASTSDEYLGLPSADVHSTSMSDSPHTPYSPDSPAPASTSRTSLIPTAVVPPGEWHAPPDSHSRAHFLLRSFFSRGRRSSGSTVGTVPVAHDVDSGLRLYNAVVLPPPYTQD